MFIVKSGGRIRGLNDIIPMRAFLGVSIMVFFYQLNPGKSVVVTMDDVPGWARKNVKLALQFYRKQMPFRANF